jgi:hypothetical protein
MQNFTKEELTILRGIYSSLGRKYNKSGRYVSLIAEGGRKVNTEVAKLILKDLKLILKILTKNKAL